MDILIVVALCVICGYILQRKKQGTAGGTGDVGGIGTNAVSTAVEFFSGFLSLCQAHAVIGNAGMSSLGKNTTGLDIELDAKIISIDGRHAKDALEVVLMSRQIAIDNCPADADYSMRSKAADEVLLRYFETDKLYFSFLDSDEYRYDGDMVIFQAKTAVFPEIGEKLIPTMREIERRLLEKWPQAKISIGNYGMSVSL